jgi:hypothetical protein
MRTRVFRFIKDVQHEPAAQYFGAKKGSLIIVDGKAYGPKVLNDRNEVSVITGHGLTDEFHIGTELEEPSQDEAKYVLRERVKANLTSDEKEAFE